MRTENLAVLDGKGRRISEAMLRPAQPTPITLADLDAADTYRRLYRETVDAAPYLKQRIDAARLHSMTRTDHAVRGFERAASDLVAFRNAGAPPTVGRLLIAHLIEQHETMYCADATPCLATLRRAELSADTTEDQVEGEQHITGFDQTPDGKRAHAAALRRQAAASLELARALEREARRDEQRRS